MTLEVSEQEKGMLIALMNSASVQGVDNMRAFMAFYERILALDEKPVGPTVPQYPAGAR